MHHNDGSATRVAVDNKYTVFRSAGIALSNRIHDTKEPVRSRGDSKIASPDYLFPNDFSYVPEGAVTNRFGQVDFLNQSQIGEVQSNFPLFLTEPNAYICRFVHYSSFLGSALPTPIESVWISVALREWPNREHGNAILPAV